MHSLGRNMHAAFLGAAVRRVAYVSHSFPAAPGRRSTVALRQRLRNNNN